MGADDAQYVYGLPPAVLLAFGDEAAFSAGGLE